MKIINYLDTNQASLDKKFKERSRIGELVVNAFSS